MIQFIVSIRYQRGGLWLAILAAVASVLLMLDAALPVDVVFG